MHHLFSGKRKFITIPLLFGIGVAFLPFTIAVLLTWFVHQKVHNTKTRHTMYAVIALLTLIFGGAWIIAMNSPSGSTGKNTLGTQTVKENPIITSYPTETVEMSLTPSPTSFTAQTVPNNPDRVLAQVVAVIDGDTIDVDLGDGNMQRIRYIGIDTPETSDPNKPVECFSKEATSKNKELVENAVVGLEKDVSETDRYGRLLRYVYLGDLFVNQVLVKEGYAHASSYPPDVKYQEQFRKAEQEAREQNKGLWSMCENASPTVFIPPTNTPSVSNDTSNTTTNNTSGESCKYSCTGPDRDCKDFSSHAEAQAFFNCCGFTAENDPMRLDAVGVGDGIACENI